MFLSEATPEQGELLESMQARLNEFLGEKSNLQKQMERVDERLKELYRTQGPRMRETEEDIDKQIKDLEYTRESQTMNLQEEKKILRKIDDLKKSKPKIRAYKAGEEELAGLKRQKSALFEAIKTRESSISELNQAIRKLQLAQRVGVPASELVSVVVEIPESTIARVIGKGGQNLKQIEESCKVAIDVLEGKKAARVTGGRQACEAARSKLEEITLSITEDLPLTENLMAVLLFQKGTLSQALQAKHNVRLDVLKAEGVLRVTALPGNVSAVKEAIAELDVGSESVPIDVKLVPAVVGKGGSNFRKLEEEFSVSIDIDRTDNVIVIRGMIGQVEAAAQEMRSLIETYEDREQSITVDKFVARMLMEDKGNLLKEFRKETGCLVLVRTEREDTEGTLIVKGQAYKLDDGVQELKKLVAELSSKVIEVAVDPELIGCIIGKKGVTIQRIRQETGAVIETELGSGIVKICSRDEAKRDHARDEVLLVIEKNQLSDLSIAKESALALKGPKGNSLREQCNKLEVQLDIDGDSGTIRLRGSLPAMEEVKGLLLSFAEENFGVEMDLLPDDFSILTGGGAETSLKKQIQDDTGATLITIKEDGLLKIRGSRTAVKAAEAAVKKALDGDDEDGRTLLLSLPAESVPFLIGKSGATINKFRDELGVDITLLRVRSQIRLRGTEPSQVLEAKEVVSKYLTELRGSYTVKATQAQQSELDHRKDLQRLAREFDVSIDRSNDSIRLRGLVLEAHGAKGRLTEFISGRSKLVLPMPPSIVAALLTQGDSNWKRIRESFAVSAEVDKVNSAVVVQGPVSGVSKAKDYVFGLLEVLFPSQFSHVAVPLGSMPNLATSVKTSSVALTGCQVWADREKDLMRFWAEDPDVVRKAVAEFNNDIKEWELTHAIVSFESWSFPLLIGKGGGRIKELEKSTGSTLDVDREAGLIKVKGSTSEEVRRAAKMLSDVVEALGKENAEVEVPREAVPSLIGKKGANLSRIREESGALIDVPNNDGSNAKLKFLPVRIRANTNNAANGAAASPPEEQVAKAKALILAHLNDWQKNNALEEVTVTEAQMKRVSGKNGSTARQIAEESGAKIELNKEKGLVVIKGKADAVASALTAVQELLDLDEEYTAPSPVKQQQQQPVAAPVPNGTAAKPAAGEGRVEARAGGGSGHATAADHAPSASTAKAGKKGKDKQQQQQEPPVPPPATAASQQAPPTAPLASAASQPPKKKQQQQQAETVAVVPPAAPVASNGSHPPQQPAVGVRKPAEAAAPPGKGAAILREVVKTDTANELLDLMLGRKTVTTPVGGTSGTGGIGGVAGARKDGGAAGGASAGQYYKSSSGLTVRL